MAERQLVEIARNLCRRARLLILDEPSATLSDADTTRIFAAIRNVTACGCAVIYISHRLDEIFNICGRVTVLRNGRVAAPHDIKDIDRPRLIADMIGRDLTSMYPPRLIVGNGDSGLKIRNLTIPNVVRDVSMDVEAKQIVGIAGQIGSGAAEVVRALAGLVPEATGSLTWCRQELNFGSRPAMLKAGFCFVPEDRASEGVFLTLSARDNLLVTAPDKNGVRGSLLSQRAPKVTAVRMAEQVGLEAARLDQPVSQLSGGNQQKIVFGRFIERHDAGYCHATAIPRVLLMNEPTRGVDVGAASTGSDTSTTPDFTNMSDKQMTDWALSQEASGAMTSQQFNGFIDMAVRPQDSPLTGGNIANQLVPHNYNELGRSDNLRIETKF